MRIYWGNVRELMRSLGSTGKPVAISYESSFFPMLQEHLDAEGTHAEDVYAVVGDSGLPELRGAPNNLRGFAGAWRDLRDRYASEVLLGYLFADYGSGIWIRKGPWPRRTVLAAASTSADFFLELKGDFDFAALEVAHHEAGEQLNDKTVYSSEEKAALVDFTREFVRVADVPVMLDRVPVGSTASRAITDRPYHWRDSWVQWLMGGDDFSGLREPRAAGVIGMDFGVATGGVATCPCDAAGDGVTNDGEQGSPSTSADDGGGYLAARAAALRRVGGLPLGASELSRMAGRAAP
jgi:hypothetical protein